jgi:inhibitor of KinA
MIEAHIVPAGDSALLVEFEERIDVHVNDRVIGLAARVAEAKVAGVRDVVPAFRSLTVHFDPLATDVDRLEELLRAAPGAAKTGSGERAGDAIRIPVSYGGVDGPDLDDVARFAGLSCDEVVAIHCARLYRVFMLGFSPGFAYLASVDPRIAMPRLESPRTRVPAGSVGIAGPQTGIYPSSTPGGWRLIGRTAVKPFDVTRRNPILFKPGDIVQFYDAH